MSDDSASNLVGQFSAGTTSLDQSEWSEKLAAWGVSYVDAAPVVEAEPAITNRRVNNCLHHLSSTHWRDVGEVAELVCRLVDVPGGLENFVSTGHGARLYRQLSVGPGGVRLYFDPVGDGGHCAFELPGEVVSSVPVDRLQAEFVKLTWRWQVSRLDTAFDHDFFSVGDVLDAIRAGDFRSYSRRSSARLAGSVCGPDCTVYLGSRQSPRMMRVYANVVHPERGRQTRFEMEYHGEKAQQVFLDLLGHPVEEWARCELGHLRDFIDFYRDWWAPFCQGAERAHMKLENWRELTLERSRKWMGDQVSASLAVCVQVYGPDWLAELVEAGRSKWGPRHHLLLAVGGVT